MIDIPTHKGKAIRPLDPNSEANTDDRYAPPLTLAEQLHYALGYAIRADEAVDRAKTPEAYSASIQAAERAWHKVERLKGAVAQEKHKALRERLTKGSQP